MDPKLDAEAMSGDVDVGLFLKFRFDEAKSEKKIELNLEFSHQIIMCLFKSGLTFVGVLIIFEKQTSITSSPHHNTPEEESHRHPPHPSSSPLLRTPKPSPHPI